MAQRPVRQGVVSVQVSAEIHYTPLPVTALLHAVLSRAGILPIRGSERQLIGNRQKFRDDGTPR
jgi:hypothetical protein